eukprot:TRINITY_DN3170_c0_g1_i1.p1 TRINITY_DN3170_c0_g1~~TRINITY_DN3170_c0_g1_i1.p1  ORF type:complete len:468 (+),score=96.86 TRINITY_DN3170_c0_g1_i1:22-1425(+)
MESRPSSCSTFMSVQTPIGENKDLWVFDNALTFLEDLEDVCPEHKNFSKLRKVLAGCDVSTFIKYINSFFKMLYEVFDDFYDGEDPVHSLFVKFVCFSLHHKILELEDMENRKTLVHLIYTNRLESFLSTESDFSDSESFNDPAELIPIPSNVSSSIVTLPRPETPVTTQRSSGRKIDTFKPSFVIRNSARTLAIDTVSQHRKNHHVSSSPFRISSTRSLLSPREEGRRTRSVEYTLGTSLDKGFGLRDDTLVDVSEESCHDSISGEKNVPLHGRVLAPSTLRNSSSDFGDFKSNNIPNRRNNPCGAFEQDWGFKMPVSQGIGNNNNNNIKLSTDCEFHLPPRASKRSTASRTSGEDLFDALKTSTFTSSATGVTDSSIDKTTPKSATSCPSTTWATAVPSGSSKNNICTVSPVRPRRFGQNLDPFKKDSFPNQFPSFQNVLVGDERNHQNSHKRVIDQKHKCCVIM